MILQTDGTCLRQRAAQLLQHSGIAGIELHHLDPVQPMLHVMPIHQQARMVEFADPGWNARRGRDQGIERPGNAPWIRRRVRIAIVRQLVLQPAGARLPARLVRPLVHLGDEILHARIAVLHHLPIEFEIERGECVLGADVLESVGANQRLQRSILHRPAVRWEWLARNLQPAVGGRAVEEQTPARGAFGIGQAIVGAPSHREGEQQNRTLHGLSAGGCVAEGYARTLHLRAGGLLESEALA